MKKLFLLGALVCASQMYGMEPQGSMGAFAQLPKELHEEIIRALLNSKDPDQAIAAVKIASVLRGVQYDLKEFKKLVNMLANRFKVPVNIIAEKINTSTAQQYIALSQMLGAAVENDQVEKVKQLIDQGADVNFLFKDYNMLELAVDNRSENSVKIMKILIDHGANPYLVAPDTDQLLTDLIEEGEFLDFYSVDESESSDYETKQSVFPQFEKLLKEAMAKHQPLGEENISGEGK